MAAVKSKFKEAGDSDYSDYSDDENAKKHCFEFDCDWNEDSNAIIMTVIDTKKDRKWQKKLGKTYYADPESEYDKIVKCVRLI